MIEYIKKNLGIKGNVSCKAIDRDRFVITIDKEYFGIFDTKRKTFVD